MLIEQYAVENTKPKRIRKSLGRVGYRLFGFSAFGAGGARSPLQRIEKTALFDKSLHPPFFKEGARLQIFQRDSLKASLTG
jgi:hypothetical protein